jgi:tetratricopeptide (TPR) repeat protein
VGPLLAITPASTGARSGCHSHSGHGLAGGLLLEEPDGTSDLLYTPDLVRLVRPARRRLKLVCLSSCQSAAATAAETRRWLELIVPEALEAEANAEAKQPPLPALARELVHQIGCAVLAMRYPVVDDFAINLDERLYEGLLGRDQELPRALQLALPAAAGDMPTSGAPALSVATPTLMGPLTVGLRLHPPDGLPSFNTGTQKMTYFPDEPERFVGRAGVMARATAVLAPANAHVGVLFYGMAGAGKTACALELAYRHETSFGQLVWWQAPEQGREIATSLRDFAVSLERQLPGLVMVPALNSQEQFDAFLPQLTELLQQNAVLLVVDNLESLLTDQGGWRDPRWDRLITALVEHRGESRVVLTSRVRPQGLEGRVVAEPVHALSLDEALLLARELPNLGRLVGPDVTAPVRLGNGALSGWTLVRRTLLLVQGHPKLLELADALAADPTVLAAQLAAADQATTASEQDRLAAFFEQGQTGLTEGHFMRVLGQWTRQAVQTLTLPAITLFGVLCCLEDSDRRERVVDTVWPIIWQHLEQPGDPPTLVAVLEPLVGSGLVAAEGDPSSFRIHPGVAEAGRNLVGGEVQQKVDTVLATFWQEVFTQALQAESDEIGPTLVTAGRGAVPYLLRLEKWAAASWLLEEVVRRDRSPGTVQAMLPLLRRIAEATRGRDRELIDASVLARVLSWVTPVAAEEQLRDVLDRATDQQRLDIASATAVDLANVLGNSGRLQEALDLAEEARELTRRAGFGPWTQLAGRAIPLRLLVDMGDSEAALAEVQALRQQMLTLPEQSNRQERVPPWHAREMVLDVGRSAARHLGRWQEAIQFNAELVHSLKSRRAPDLEIAHCMFNDYLPLLRLRQLAKAQRLLQACREVFEAENDLGALGQTLGALAELEAERGRPEEAIPFEQTALRYAYVVGDPEAIAAGHHSLATSLRDAGRERDLTLAHRLAAAFVYYQMGSGWLPVVLSALVKDMAVGDQPSPLPESFEELCVRVGQVEGVRLADLVARLPRRQASNDEMLTEVLQLARTWHEPVRYAVVQWKLIIDKVIMARGGDRRAAAELELILAEQAKDRWWTELVKVLRRIVAGEHGDNLTQSLDQIDTAIVSETLRRLAEP